MTSISYRLVGVVNDYNALGVHVQAYLYNNASLYSWDGVNYTIDVYYPYAPTDEDVQYLVDVLNAYQEPPYFLSYAQTQINSCRSAWSTSAKRQILMTNQIPAYIIQAAMFNAQPSFLINTIKWLLEFDMSDSEVSAETVVAFDLVDISNPTKQVLKSVNLTIGEVRAASFANDIDPSHLYKNVVFDDLVLLNPTTSGVWQLEVVPGDNVRVRTVSQEIMWYTIQFGIDFPNPPALPVKVPPMEVYKLPSDMTPHLGSTNVTVEPPSWSSVSGPSGENVTVEIPDPSGYPARSLPDSDSSSTGTNPSDPSDPSSGPGDGNSPSPSSDPESSTPVSSDPASITPSSHP